jgi:hypothetical protein
MRLLDGNAKVIDDRLEKFEKSEIREFRADTITTHALLSTDIKRGRG